MDKITRIHIAKVPYEIGISAQIQLEKYLQAIRSELDADLADDTMADIEVRITEILNERHIKRNDVITSKDIHAIQEQLGSPEQFNDGDTKHDDTAAHGSESKKLLRDTDGALLGGVAGGLGAYFGIDPVFVRVAFVVVTIFWGLGILLYLLLWLLVPPAKTSSDKLLMRGEPVTAATLQRSRVGVQQTIANLRLRAFFHLLYKVFRACFSVGALAVILGLLTFSGIGSAILYTQPLHPLFTAYHLNYVVLALLWLLVMIIIGLIIVALLRLWRQRTSSLKIAFVTLIGLMVVTIAGLAVVSPFAANYYHNQYSGNKLAEPLALTSNSATKPTSLNIVGGSSLNVTYVISNQPLHATYQAIPGMKRPKIYISNNKGVVSMSTGQLSQAVPNCVLDWCKNLYLPVRVTVYGPALQKFSVNGSAEFDISNFNQPNITFSGTNNATINLYNSYSNTLSLSVTNGSTIDASDTTAQTANISIQDDNSSISGPASATLNIAMPTQCDQTLLFLVQTPVSITLNGQSVTQDVFNQNSCTSIDNENAIAPAPPSKHIMVPAAPQLQ